MKGAVPRLEATSGYQLLRILLAFALLYYAALVVDLLLHPWALGLDFEGGLGRADRLLEALAGSVVIAIGVFIIRRVPGNPVGPLMILYGVGTTGWITRQDLGSPLFSALAHSFFDFYFYSVAVPAGVALLLCFPTGQFFPRSVKPWVGVYVLLLASASLLTLMAETPGRHDPLGWGDLPVNPLYIPVLAPYYNLLNGPVSSLLALLGLVGATVSLFMRYRNGKARERLQIKWLVWVMGLLLALAVFYVIPTLYYSRQIANSPFLLSLVILFYALLGTSPAIGVGLAILRSRLWDIDVIIRKTLIYGALTAILALLYSGGVVVFQQLFRTVTGQSSDLAVVLSTLGIAVLFNPLRLRLQQAIDRRFYRGTYDAEEALFTFSASIRTQVDLETMTSALLKTVQETLEPESLELWLSSAKPAVRRRTQPDGESG